MNKSWETPTGQPGFPGSGLRLDIKGVGCAISACRQRWRSALSLVCQGVKQSIQLSSIAVNSGIAACSTGHQWQMALKLRDEIWGFEELVTRLNSVAKACEHGLHWNRVIGLMRGMSQWRCVPDNFSCSTVVSACSRTEHWEHSLDLWRELNRYMTPNIVAYGAACVASRLKSAEAALELLEEMELKSLKRNLIICNIHLTSYAAGTHWQEALVLLEEMLSDDSELPEPNLISLREVSEAVGSACGLHSRELFGRLQCLVDDVLMPNESDRASFKKRRGFSSLVPLNAAIEAMELLDSHDSLSARSVFALQGQMLPVLFALQRLAAFSSVEESIRSLESSFCCYICWWFRNPYKKPVEVGSLSHYYKFLYISQLVGNGISEPLTVSFLCRSCHSI